MSPQDSQKLNDFLTQLIQARGIQKDAEADALIQRAVAQQPDAAYLLVQRALLLEQGLNGAREQIAALQEQVRNQPGDGKFLDANTWGNSGANRPAAAPAPQQVQEYQPPYQQPAPPPYQPQYQPGYQQAAPAPGGFLRGGLGGGFGGGLGGTLGTIATTAAGVAAGSFLFQGLENMFSHHEHGGNRLLNGDDPSNNLFSDQSGSSLANQAGVGDVDGSIGRPAEGLFDGGAGNGNRQGLFDNGDNGSRDDGQGLFDSGVDNADNAPDNSGGFFDGDGSDDGLFS